MLPHRTAQRGPFIGLEIGSHAVRAAELTVRGGPTLHRFAQVDLPPGAVADGEVVDVSAVGSALKQLWAEGKFSHRRVVVGVSSQRATVRQADVQAMSDEDLRSALQFEAQDLIPIPVEEALLDFSVIDPHLHTDDAAEPPKMRILLAAAQRDMVKGHLDALKAAGLKPVAVDPVALALLRAIPVAGSTAAAGDGATAPVVEAVIAVGAPLTTVAIRENGMTRFVRVLNIGGDDLSDGSPGDPAAAPGGNQPAPAQAPAGTITAAARSMVGSRMRVLVEDIRGSLDFYLAQADTDRVDRVVVTGGAALTEGFLTRLQNGLGRAVEIADPLSTVAVGKTGLSEEQLQQAVPFLVTPIGLALWGTVTGRPISLLPKEVLQARRQRRFATAVGCAVMAFAVALGLVWAGRTVQVNAATQQASKAQGQVTSLNSQIVAVSDVTRVKADVKAHQALYASALGNEVDWIRLMEQVTAVMPQNVHLTALTVARSGTSLGTITMASVSTAGPDSAADWLRALETLPGLRGAWVQTITQTTGSAGAPNTVAFNSSASVTSAAVSARSVQAGVSP